MQLNLAVCKCLTSANASIQCLESCVWGWQKIYRRVTNRVCMACKARFCWCLQACPFCKLCKKKITIRKAAITQHKNAVDCKRNENAVAVVGRLNFPGANQSVTAAVRKVEIELAASLWWHCSTAAVKSQKSMENQHGILSFWLQINLVSIWYIFRLDLVYSL